MKRIALTLVACALVLAARDARAASGRWGSFDLMFGPYTPDIDAEFTNGARPWQDDFGTSDGWMFRAGGARALYTGFGSLELGVQTGYFQKNGYAQFASGGGTSKDRVKFRMIPTSATLTYRFDWLAEQHRIPFAPYARVAFERYNWWINDAEGETTESGATNGWSASFGLALLLDVFDPSLARELDADTGINHTYLFAELRKTRVDDFGSRSSWILSDDRALSLSGGLLFVF